jgi:small ligand-binding sensory domain FIST
VNTLNLHAVQGRVGHAHAAGDDWRRALSACGDALSSARAHGALGLIYVTESWATHLGDMAATLQSRLGVGHWVGCAGQGIFAANTQYLSTPAMSVLVLPVGEDQISPLDTLMTEAAATTQATTPWFRMNAPVLGLVHADPRNSETENMIRALMSDDVGGGFVVGGLTAVVQGSSQLAGSPAAGGLSGVLLASSVPVATTLTQGCTPMGGFRRVTSGRRGVIGEIDGRRALDVLKDDVGELLARDLRRMGGYVHVALPVDGSDTGDYTVRNLLGVDAGSGVIAVGADLNAGDALMFVRRDPASAQKDLVRALEALKKRIGARRILAGHYVSCVARPAMFGLVGGEAELIRDTMGDFPLTGFFANGEICGSRLYGYTGVLTVFLDQPPGH